MSGDPSTSSHTPLQVLQELQQEFETFGVELQEEGEEEKVKVQQVLGEKDAEGRPHGEVRCRGLCRGAEVW